MYWFSLIVFVMYKLGDKILALEKSKEKQILEQVSPITRTDKIGPDVLISGRASIDQQKTKMVLLIDDDETVGQTIKTMLTVSGYEVVLVDNGIDALQNFDSNKIGLVISDLFMPGMSGWEVIAELRKKSPTVPIFIFTGYMDELIYDHRDRVKELGINEILLKPIRMKQLVEKVAPYLNAVSAEVRIE
jgi:CheY-like chemotaxis protein